MIDYMKIMENIAALLLPNARFEVNIRSAKMDILAVTAISPDETRHEFEVHTGKYSLFIFMPVELCLPEKRQNFLSRLEYQLEQELLANVRLTMNDDNGKLKLTIEI